MHYENQVICRGKGWVKLSAEPIVQFDSSADEVISLSVPHSWEATFREELLVGSNYKCFQLIGTLQPQMLTSRLSDYKKIWGLFHLSKGVLDGYYDVNQGRVYWGILELKDSFILSYKFSSIFMFVPKSQSADFTTIISFLSAHGYTFSGSPVILDLIPLKEELDKTIMLQYSKEDSLVAMTIISNNVESCFYLD